MAEGLRLVLFGPPGAGKGTQTRLLAGHLEVQSISTGDLFRSNLQQLSRAERNCTSGAEQNCTTERRGVSIKAWWSVRAQA